MKDKLLQILVWALGLYARLLRTGGQQRRVVLVSRQSAKPSLEYRMLYEELAMRLGQDNVSYCLTTPETKGLLAFARGTLRQFSAVCHSRVVVTDGYNAAVSLPPQSSCTRVVQLWHAMGAIKKFGYQSLDTPAGRSSSFARIGHMHENYDLIVAGGPGAIGAFAQAFGYDEEHVVALGSPRIDYLHAVRERGLPSETRQRVHEALPCLDDGTRTLLYAPTMRKGPQTRGWIDRNLRALAMNCDPARDSIVFAGHPLDCDVAESLVEEYPCLHVARGIGTLELLPEADIVITDYSAIAFDAGLLGCDVCFYVPDIESYRRSPGLNVDWLEQGIGIASTSAVDLFARIANPDDAAMAQGFQDFRDFVAGYFAGIDANGTQRIADAICELLDE